MRYHSFSKKIWMHIKYEIALTCMQTRCPEVWSVLLFFSRIVKGDSIIKANSVSKQAVKAYHTVKKTKRRDGAGDSPVCAFRPRVCVCVDLAGFDPILLIVYALKSVCDLGLPCYCTDHMYMFVCFVYVWLCVCAHTAVCVSLACLCAVIA